MSNNAIEILDIKELKRLTNEFYNITNMPVVVFDNRHNILWKEGSENLNDKICVNQSCRLGNCIERYCDEFDAGECKHGYSYLKCQNGLMMIGLPIRFEKNTFGFIFTGQFFLENQDVDAYRKNMELQYESLEEFMQVMGSMPVIKKERVDLLSRLLLGIVDTVLDRSSGNIDGIKVCRENKNQETNLKDHDSNVSIKNEYKNLLNDSIIRNISEGICVSNPILEYPFVKFTVWNPRLQEITGYSMEEINRSGWQHALFPDESLREKAIKKRENMIAGFEVNNEEWGITRKDGEKRILAISTRNLGILEGCIHTLSLIKDITEQRKMEDALKESEINMSIIYDNSVHLISEVAPDGIIRYANPSHCVALGYEPGELVGKNIFDFMHPDDIHSGAIDFKKLITSENVFNKEMIECKFRHRDGHYLVLDGNGKVIYDENGNIKGIIFSTRDVTERRRIEEELKQNELFLRQIADNTLYMIVRADTEGIFEYITPSVRNILGYDQEYMVGKSIFEFLHPDDMPYIMNEYSEMFRDNVTKKVKCRYRNVDNDYIWLEVEGKPVDHEGRIIGAVYSIRDVTKQIEAENLLKQSEEKYRMLVELFPDSVIVRTKDRVVLANNAAAKLVGVNSASQIIGRKLTDFVRVDRDYNRQNRERSIDELLKAGKPLLTQQKFYLISNNSEIYVETAACRFPYYPEEAWIVVTRDISERIKLGEKFEEKTRLLNDALEFDRMKTEFIANISHELRTPINVILSALQMAALVAGTFPSNEEIKRLNKYLGTMRQNGFRLIRLVNNLIDISKIDAGYLELKMVNSNIVSIVEDIVTSVIEYAQDKGLELVFDTNVEEKIMACDQDKIERIILNLLSNSIKFTNPGGKITVKVINGKNNVFISVKDSGIGIPITKQKLIFDRFMQVDKSLSRGHEGSGIGLSLVKSLVEMHGGKIRVKSISGKGSIFIVMLPVRTLDEKSEISARYHNKNKTELINIEFSDIYM